jgi:uncharacterized protein with PQ loop repeat
MLNSVADIFGMAGMGFFLFAEIRQLVKILKTKRCTGISWTAYKVKMIACLCTLLCFGLSALWGSFLVILAETVVIVPTMRFLWREKCQN